MSKLIPTDVERRRERQDEPDHEEVIDRSDHGAAARSLDGLFAFSGRASVASRHHLRIKAR